jgi:transcription initiation factor TFIIIB Brf1 subunit/transcription initiation factor TFIIB
MHECPKCHSTETHKDRRMGSDTGDRICNKCGYTSMAHEFKKAAENSPKKES